MRNCYGLLQRLQGKPFQRGDRLYTSESDVCRRQILTYNDGPRTERIKICPMTIRYSNGAEIANYRTCMMISN